MKHLIFSLLLFPFAAMAQTAHINDGELEFKGTVEIRNLSQEELSSRLGNAVLHATGLAAQTEKEKLKVNAQLVLAPRSREERRTLLYRLELQPTESGYKYKIEDVVLLQHLRHGGTDTLSSKKIVAGMDISGRVAIGTEALLNEIDMRLQDVLGRIRTEVEGKSGAVKKTGR